jgi:predicted secreted protein
MKNISMLILIIFIFGLLLALFFYSSKNKFQDSITLELFSNPTTGYDWYYSFEKDNIKNNIIQEVLNKYIPAKPKDFKIYGSGGKRVWQFKGVKPGTTKIKFEYKRPGQNNNNHIKSIEFIFKVNKQNKIKLIKKNKLD